MKRMEFKNLNDFTNYYFIARNGNMFSVDNLAIDKEILLEGLRRYNGEMFNMIDTLQFVGIAKNVLYGFSPLISGDNSNDFVYLKSKKANNKTLHMATSSLFYYYKTRGVPDNHYFVFPNERYVELEEIIFTLDKFDDLAKTIRETYLSNYEKLLYVYLYVQKKHIYDPKAKNNDIVSYCLLENGINSIGASNILGYILEYLDFDYDEVLTKKDNQESYSSALLVKIDDRKYKIHGRYILDLGEDLKLVRNYKNNDTFSLSNFCLSTNEYNVKEGTTTYSSKLLSSKSISTDALNLAYNNVSEFVLDRKSKYSYSMFRILKNND